MTLNDLEWRKGRHRRRILLLFTYLYIRYCHKLQSMLLWCLGLTARERLLTYAKSSAPSDKSIAVDSSCETRVLPVTFQSLLLQHVSSLSFVLKLVEKVDDERMFVHINRQRLFITGFPVRLSTVTVLSRVFINNCCTEVTDTIDGLWRRTIDR